MTAVWLLTGILVPLTHLMKWVLVAICLLALLGLYHAEKKGEELAGFVLLMIALGSGMVGVVMWVTTR